MNDLDHMRHALTLTERALGRVAPNPAVGCVIVSPDDRVLGRGWTQPGGRPHAETVALAQVGQAARGSTAYVTLEPCAHHGHTPPCAEALVAAGVARVVAAVEDPDPRVKGKGFALLRGAGIDITTGVLEKDAAELNAGFFLRIKEDRPLVALKIAQSRDGKTIPPPGASRWITGEEARRFAHLLRAKHDAVLVGVGTVLADDPMLDCRLPGLEDRSPIRVVLDTHLRLPTNSRLAQTALRISTIVFTTAEGGEDLERLGTEVLRVMKGAQGRPDLRAVLGVLAQRGMTRLLVEGGPTVISRFLEESLADCLEVFTAPTELGDTASGEIAGLSDRTRFLRTATRKLGPDLLESYRLRA
ncbi:MAG TPA: bifunctional diaminohydroxyphosphoribosylaminopyrimidine deaminase/5-amino-6-(5-phosphoribosylamino)uracil reductase RibD [Rhizomicrobium sp.]|nr:bifunctional diaminohydroxyphosphoribosylaminopyrimidine deaminase/5-amino-6-(5-phosphoribosylamino)uracil reductase RibD [Rhizomicrobium sp.]